MIPSDLSSARSPPSWWSGLKSVWYPCILIGINVSTLVVEWIEMEREMMKCTGTGVSTLVVEWIEIPG